MSFPCVGASMQFMHWMSMCVCVCAGLNTAQSAGDNKEFVVGLECPERLELWQLQRS